MNRVWVAYDPSDSTILGVAETAALAIRLAEEDAESELIWREKPDGSLYAGEIDYPDYRIRHFEVTR